MPPREERKRPAPEIPRKSSGETYRTLCVRLCDGFYFPMSFATTRGKLEDDAGRCERQCPSKGRLFTHRNPGQSVDDMVDLRGNPYAKLATAFRFRAEFVTDCTCRGNPWDAKQWRVTRPIRPRRQLLVRRPRLSYVSRRAAPSAATVRIVRSSKPVRMMTEGERSCFRRALALPRDHGPQDTGQCPLAGCRRSIRPRPPSR